MAGEKPSFPLILALVLTGAVLGLLGGFLQSLTVSLGPVPVPAGALLALAAVIAVIRAVVHGTGTRAAGIAVLAGWALISLALALTWPGGDVVLGRQPVAMGYLFGGAVVVSMAANLPASLRPAGVGTAGGTDDAGTTA